MAALSWRAGRCWCIAHRGGAAEAPENTLAAFRHAVAVDADMVELDARLSRDGVAVVCHDERVDRVTTATGAIGAFDADELAGLGVPRLGPALAACAPLPVTLELKEGGALVGAADEVVEASDRAEAILVASFDDDALAAWRRRRPGHPTSLGERELAGLVQAAHTGNAAPARPAAAVAAQLPHRHQGRELVTAPVVAAAHEQGLAVHVWTVNDADDMRRLRDLGVDGIITDRPRRLRSVLGERAAS